MGSHVSSHLSGSAVLVGGEHGDPTVMLPPREITRIENSQQMQQDDGGFTNVISFLGNKLKDILAGDMVSHTHLSQSQLNVSHNDKRQFYAEQNQELSEDGSEELGIGPYDDDLTYQDGRVSA